MPIYEYRCRACGERLERLRKLSDPPLTLCPECGEEALERLVSAPAFQFKGAGWYVTDYAGKGKEKEGGGKAEKEAEGKTADAESSGSKTESASSSTSESKKAASSSD